MIEGGGGNRRELVGGPSACWGFSADADGISDLRNTSMVARWTGPMVLQLYGVDRVEHVPRIAS
jgi:hypothetical protein